MALVGTKLDALETKKRMVNFDKMIEIAEQHNMLFNETSSRTGEGISELFLDLAKQIAKK
jgi:GTPase SAR1 family protein